jgi:hypothetical protein
MMMHGPLKGIVSLKIPCDKSSAMVINHGRGSNWKRFFRVRNIQANRDFSSRAWYVEIFGS